MNKGKINNFKVYYLCIVILSILTTNFVSVISHNSETSLRVLIGSAILFLFIHKWYYKFFFDNGNKIKRIPAGIYYSSIIGAILISILMILIYLHTNNPKYDFNKENEVINFTSIMILFIYILCSLIS